MGKRQKKINNGETKTQVVKAERKRVNERHQNGLYSDADLTPADKQTDLYKRYIEVTGIQYCKRFLRDEKNKKDLPQWGEIELNKLNEIVREHQHKSNKKFYQNESNRKILKLNNQKYQRAHKEACHQRQSAYYGRILDSIKDIQAGHIDKLSDQRLLSVQSLMKKNHKKFLHNTHGLHLGDKNSSNIYDRNNLQGFKAFLKSQIGIEAIPQSYDAMSQTDFNELGHMHLDQSALGDEGEDIFNSGYLNNDSILNENNQQDNRDQLINTQKEQTMDKNGFITYGHETDSAINNGLFTLNLTNDYQGQTI